MHSPSLRACKKVACAEWAWCPALQRMGLVFDCQGLQGMGICTGQGVLGHNRSHGWHHMHVCEEIASWDLPWFWLDCKLCARVSVYVHVHMRMWMCVCVCVCVCEA